MDFVPANYGRRDANKYSLKLGLGMAGISSAAIAQLPVLMEMGILGPGSGMWGLTSFMGSLFGGVGLIVAVGVPLEERETKLQRARKERIWQLIQERYGLSLSWEQLDALSYPKTDPGNSFQTFGSFKLQDRVDGANFIERTIYLISTDGELKLSESRDGKRFKELKPARPALEGSATSSREALEASTDHEKTPQTPSLALGASA